MGVYEDDEQTKRIDQAYEKKRLRDQSDLAKVLTMREGRRLVWRILSMAGVFALSYSGEAQWETNFNEGKRSIGNLLLKDIQPEVELAMKREAANDKLLQDTEQKEKSDG
jgi:hypothetical protein